MALPTNVIYLRAARRSRPARQPARSSCSSAARSRPRSGSRCRLSGAAILAGLTPTALRVVSGTLFFPRGGSAFVTRALARALAGRGCAVTLVVGSRRDLEGLGDAHRFYAGIDVHAVDFTAALGAPDPMAFDAPAG